MSEDKSNPDSKVLIPEILEALENKQLIVCNSYPISALHGKKTLKGKNDITNEKVFEYADKRGLLRIKDFEKQTKEFGNLTLRAINYAIHCFTKQNHLGQDIKQIKREVRFKVKDYQKIRGLKNYSKTRKQLINDVNLLYDVSLKFDKVKVRDGKKYKLVGLEARILSSKIETQKGDVLFSFTPEFAEFLVKSGFLMLLPEEYFSMKSPVASEILHKLYTHARINKYVKKKKEGKGKRTVARKSFEIISVEALLKSVGSIPSYEEVINSNDRHVQKRIIDPLEKGLDELLERQLLVSWETCNAKGKPLTTEQSAGVDENGDEVEIKSKKDKYCYKWDNFKKLYIKYNLNTPIETTLVPPTKELSPEKRGLKSV